MYYNITKNTGSQISDSIHLIVLSLPLIQSGHKGRSQGLFIDCTSFKKFSLIAGDANNFHYTKQGGSPVIEGVDDAKEMAQTRQACTLLGM